MASLLTVRGPERNTGFAGAVTSGLQLMMGELNARDRLIAARNENIANTFAQSAAITREFQRQAVAQRQATTNFIRQNQLLTRQQQFTAEQNRLNRQNMLDRARVNASRQGSGATSLNNAIGLALLRQLGEEVPGTDTTPGAPEPGLPPQEGTPMVADPFMEGSVLLDMGTIDGSTRVSAGQEAGAPDRVEARAQGAAANAGGHNAGIPGAATTSQTREVEEGQPVNPDDPNSPPAGANAVSDVPAPGSNVGRFPEASPTNLDQQNNEAPFKIQTPQAPPAVRNRQLASPIRPDGTPKTPAELRHGRLIAEQSVNALTAELTQLSGNIDEGRNRRYRKAIAAAKNSVLAHEAALDAIEQGKTDQKDIIEAVMNTQVYQGALKPLDLPELDLKTTTAEEAAEAEVRATAGLNQVEGEIAALAQVDTPEAIKTRRALFSKRAELETAVFEAKKVQSLRDSEKEAEEDVARDIQFNDRLIGEGSRTVKRTAFPQKTERATGEMSQINQDVANMDLALSDAIRIKEIVSDKSVSGLMGLGKSVMANVAQQMGTRAMEDFSRNRSEAGTLTLRLINIYKPIFDRLTDTDVRLAKEQLPDPQDPFKTFVVNQGLADTIIEQILGTSAAGKIRRAGYDIGEFNPVDILSAMEQNFISELEAIAVLRGRGIKSWQDTKRFLGELPAEELAKINQLLSSAQF